MTALSTFQPSVECEFDENQMFDDDVEESIWERAADSAVSPSSSSSSLVIQLREELVDLLQFVYKDICTRGFQEAIRRTRRTRRTRTKTRRKGKT